MLVKFDSYININSMIAKLPFRIRYERRKSYGVNMVSGFENPNDVGSCNPNTKEIKIMTGMSEKETVSTLTHEVFHQINFERELSLTEDQVLGMELGFMKALELNQDFLRLIYDTYRKSNRGAK